MNKQNRILDRNTVITEDIVDVLSESKDTCIQKDLLLNILLAKYQSNEIDHGIDMLVSNGIVAFEKAEQATWLCLASDYLQILQKILFRERTKRKIGLSASFSTK